MTYVKIRKVLLAPLALLALYGSDTSAADQNGYNAQYECRAGGPYCNVDVAALGTRTCDQTISASTPWSAINWSNNTICLEAGDHRAKGVLTIPASASGSSASRKVVRYIRSNDTNDEPWAQSHSPARLKGLIIGASYWLVHRLTFDGSGTNVSSIRFPPNAGAGNNILNRLLGENGGSGFNAIITIEEGNNFNTVQNSVLRNAARVAGEDNDVFQTGGNTGTRLVNNEIYGCHSHCVYVWANSGAPGLVVENNDIYNDESQLTDCRGNYTPSNPNSPCADNESLISLKTGGASSNPALITHNRLWNSRFADTSICCNSGATGLAISLSRNDDQTDGSRYVLVQNNVLMGNQFGIQFPGQGAARNNNTIIGNIIYNTQMFYAGWGASAAISEEGNARDCGVYLNTIIRAANAWSEVGSGNGNYDSRCNVVISSGGRRGNTPDGGTQVDANAFYDTPVYTVNGANNNLSSTVSSRANSTTYSAGSIVRTASVTSCVNTSDSACFLYKALVPGTTEGSPPAPCTTIGCTYSDGGVTWQAIRGPYTLKRKLKTVSGGENYVIPYARPHSSAMEYRACPASTGTRAGVGINDTLLF